MHPPSRTERAHRLEACAQPSSSSTVCETLPALPTVDACVPLSHHVPLRALEWQARDSSCIKLASSLVDLITHAPTLLCPTPRHIPEAPQHVT